MKKIHLKQVIFILLAFIFILIASYCATEFDGDKRYMLVFIPILSTMGSFFGVTVVTEILTLKSFFNQILEINDISQSVAQSGINKYYDNFSTDIIWKHFFKRINKTLVFNISYGESWRNIVRAELIALLKKDVTIKVYLPNYNDNAVMNALDKRYSYGEFSSDSKVSIKVRIKTAIKDFQSFKKYGDIKVFLFNGTFQHSYYIVDNSFSLIAFQKHGADRSSVPAIEVVGTFLRWALHDMKRIEENSEEAPRIDE